MNEGGKDSFHLQKLRGEEVKKYSDFEGNIYRDKIYAQTSNTVHY